jgi:hypothetical protein
MSTQPTEGALSVARSVHSFFGGSKRPEETIEQIATDIDRRAVNPAVEELVNVLEIAEHALEWYSGEGRAVANGALEEVRALIAKHSAKGGA